MATVEQLENKFNALIQNLTPANRRKLAINIGRKLAQSQRRRIGQQQNPDGTAFEPRKQKVGKLRKKKGRIKRQAMFAKLKTARFLKVKTNENGVTVGFNDNSAHIASVHQYGLMSAPSKKANYKVKYAQRELLGFTDEDLEMIEEEIIKMLAES